MPNAFTLPHLIPATIMCNGVAVLFLIDEESEAHIQRDGVTFVSDKGRFHYEYFASKPVFFPLRENG